MMMAELSPQFNTEQYDEVEELGFRAVLDHPLSTLSIDVDTASYANVRRFINEGRLPPPDAVRIEEMINYFSYDYPEPVGVDPFSINMELSKCPWNKDHRLALIGLQGKSVNLEDLPPNNLVFLLDVSGSMNTADKLPLLKSAMRMLVDELRLEDRVSIVVYAGASGLILKPTSDKEAILEAINQLSAGGSTAGGAGIELAYKTAEKYFIEGGNNRVILATDGDFNVGVSSDGALVRLIEKKRESGVYLSVLGFGTGNIKDSKMEKLADKGNGNYAYIDSQLEAKKVLVNELGATLLTIAKDVKVQVEFNPSVVKAYRLIGYENRMLAAEDFDNDQKDEGELGAGHSVTALYELIPAGSDEEVASAGELAYQSRNVLSSDDLMTVKFRYKQPDSDVSQLLVCSVKAQQLDGGYASDNLRFAGAVAEFGLILRDSKFKGDAALESVLQQAEISKGADVQGYRSGFIELVKRAAEL
ncbi:MAG: VWA domain-containing protein [Pontiellaceae bacterium]|nr:VWA domain-containing protein [Pontiellaceae bacterium]